MPQKERPWLLYNSYVCSSSSVRKGAAIRMTFSGSPLSSNKFLKGVATIGTEVVVIGCIGCMRFCITAAMTIAISSALAILSGVVGIMGFKSSEPNVAFIKYNI